MAKMYRIVPALFIAMAMTACGDKEQTTAAPAQPAADAAAPAESTKPEQVASNAGEASAGEKVFKSTCSMCHQTGAAGAPIVGNKDEWAARIAQGSATLYDHAINGYTGQKGMMPAKGANASLSDDDVKAAVDYIVSKSQ